MRVKRTACAVTALLVSYQGTVAFGQSVILDRFVGKDLRQASIEELKPLFKALRGSEKEEVDLPYPWHVWKMRIAGVARYVVFEGQPLQSIPGESFAVVHLFDSEGKALGKWHFSTGWRIHLEDALINYSEELGASLLIVQSHPATNGRDVARQYFAFSYDRLRFIRMEDSSGRALDNRYLTFGVKPEAQTVNQWIELLESPSKVDLLSALVYIGGIEDARSVVELRSNERVRRLVYQHAKSANTWIKEAADLASKHLW